MCCAFYFEIIIPRCPSVGKAGDIVMSSCVRYLHDNLKNSGEISSILWPLSGCLASMSLHLGSEALLEVEISKVKSLVAGIEALLFNLQWRPD